VVRKDNNKALSELALNYGSLRVRALRDIYANFAPHCADDLKLREVLADLDVASLTQVLRDCNCGNLKQISRLRLAPESKSHGHTQRRRQ
jgi:hypothetical protein